MFVWKNTMFKLLKVKMYSLQLVHLITTLTINKWRQSFLQGFYLIIELSLMSFIQIILGTKTHGTIKWD